MDWSVEDHLDGKPDLVVGLYHAFEDLVSACGPYEISVAKTAITFKGPVRGFAGATPRKGSLAGYLDLMEECGDEEPFTRADAYTGKLWVNRFVIHEPQQMTASFARRVAEAYEIGRGAHRN